MTTQPSTRYETMPIEGLQGPKQRAGESQRESQRERERVREGELERERDKRGL